MPTFRAVMTALLVFAAFSAFWVAMALMWGWLCVAP